MIGDKITGEKAGSADASNINLAGAHEKLNIFPSSIDTNSSDLKDFEIAQDTQPNTADTKSGQSNPDMDRYGRSHTVTVIGGQGTFGITTPNDIRTMHGGVTYEEKK